MNINKLIELIKNTLHIYSPKTYKDGSTVSCNYIRKEYYNTNELLYETPYVNDEKHGIEKWYYKDGELKYEIPYTNGQIDGILKWYYYESGKLGSETPYVNGKRHGIQKVYYSTNKLLSETPYENDKIHGIIKQYNERGQLKAESRYVDGELISTSSYNDKNVKIS